ncbi:MAG: hypothetical protein EOM50_25020 [Erysipelotrichia bacterium]|nr:hypothetical protein [Erysipelotrichia bacterium]
MQLMTTTLLFYKLSERFNDDERLIAYFIDEENAQKIYKHLLKGHFDRYAIMLQDKLNNFDGNLEEWKADCKVKLDFSRNELFVHTDMQNIEGQ